MKLRLHLPLLLVLMTPATHAGAQIYAEVEAAQIDSLGSILAKELRRVTGLTLVSGISESTRALNAFVYNSAREASEISTRLQFIESLRPESPDNPSLTEKLLGETTKLRGQAETLGRVVRAVAPTGSLSRMLGDLVAQASALERSIGQRPVGP
jgi:hypothetical protein